MISRNLVATLAAIAIFAGTLATEKALAQTASSASRVQPHIIQLTHKAHAMPPTTAYCLTNYGIHCYQPFQMAKAYGLDRLHKSGIDGRGTTIVIVDAYGSPTIASDLSAFDQAFGIKDPPSFTIIQPAGPVPAFDPTNSDMVGWAAETTLDVEWAHVFAPGAAILLVETPVSETEGVQGFPEIVAAENYVIDHDLGDVISQSFGATEPTFPSPQSILQLRSAYKNAAKHHVTVLAATGDYGATDVELNLVDIFTTPVIDWPSSDPLVTAVGGTQLTLDDNGERISPDVGWSFGGGGVSSVFARPEFQDPVNAVVGKSRGIPDISMSASCDGAVVYYYSFIPGFAGFDLVCGTSEATPEFAGIVAMANQIAGHRLGTLGEKLYELRAADLVDVTVGNNSFGPFTNSDGNTYFVPGYNALVGYDLVTGLGTVDAPRFVHALADD